MSKKKLTLVETGSRRSAMELDPMDFPDPKRRAAKMLDLLSRAYLVTNAANTVEWAMGQHLSVAQVEEIIGRDEEDQVDVSIRKGKTPGK